MHPEALILLIVGLVLVGISSVFAITHPRREGEPFGPQRKMMLALCLTGGLCIAAFAIIFLTALTVWKTPI